MEFANPFAGWLLLLIIPLYYIAKNSIAGLPVWRFITSMVLRIIIFLLIIASLSEIQLLRPVNKLSVVFVLDLSKSTGSFNREEAIKFINKAIEKKGKNDEAGLIVFGGNALVEFVPSEKAVLSEFTSMIDKGNTDISRALRLALAVFPANTNKRLVLLSDGQENSGDSINESFLISANGIPVDIIPLNNPVTKELFIQDFSMPQKVNLNEPFDAKVSIESTLNTKGKILIFRNKKLICEENLKITKGKNIFFIPQKIDESGFYSYEVSLITNDREDTFSENNRAWAYTKIMGNPRVLLVDRDPDKAKYLLKALRHKKIDVTFSLPQNLPGDFSELQNYNSVIFSDVSALNISHEQMLQIQSYVKNLGGGFIMIGGENSFGIGGYYKTPIEETLPVSMEIRKDRKLPTMALVLVIDKSGSMSDFGKSGIEKIALARESAIACVELLSPSDQIGVICFDDAAKCIVPFQQRTENKDRIIGDIASMRAGGGTNAYPALNMAVDNLSKTEAVLKHIIILSDGMTAPGDFDGLTGIMKKKKITLSSVAIGQDADIPFMQNLARKGGGRFYFSTDGTALPQIFTKEAFLASRSAMVEKPFLPSLNKYGQILQAIDWEHVPKLGGYVVTSPKERAEVLLLAPDNDPLLARWYYGIGKSVAFTSDAKSRWAKEWIKWDSFPSFWAQTVRWTMRSDESPFLDSEVFFENGEGRIIVDAVDEEGEFINLLDLKAQVVSPKLDVKEINLEQKGSGRYEATFPCSVTGTYLVNVGGDKVGYQNLGFSYSTGPEYKNLGTDNFLLGRIAAETGGRKLTLKDYDKIFIPPQEKNFEVKEIWPYLILWAIFLFPLDIAVRRIFLPDGWQEKILNKFRREKKIIPEETPLTFMRLKERKSDVVTEREKKFTPLSEMVSGKTHMPEKKIFVKEEKTPPVVKKETQKPLEPEKSTGSLSRLRDAKKKALDDFK